MKAIHFFVPYQKKRKFFMALVLSSVEQASLVQGGGFDKIAGTVGWIENLVLKGSLQNGRQSYYIFWGCLVAQLNYIRDQLAKKMGHECEIRNIETIPTFAELLAENHSVVDAGTLDLYVDHGLPLRNQRRGMLFATYRPTSVQNYVKFWEECRSLKKYVKIAFWTREVIVTRGFPQSGYARLQRYLNEQEGFSLTTNVVEAENYPMLLLKSVI